MLYTKQNDHQNSTNEINNTDCYDSNQTKKKKFKKPKIITLNLLVSIPPRIKQSIQKERFLAASRIPIKKRSKFYNSQRQISTRNLYFFPPVLSSNLQQNKHGNQITHPSIKSW